MIRLTRAAFVLVAATAACVRSSGSSAPIVAPPPAPAPATHQSPGAPPSISVQSSTVMSSPVAVTKTAGDSVSPADVTRLAAEVFGKAAKAVPSTDSDDSGPAWDIDVESYASRARVERYVRLFSGSAKERIESRLSKGTQYEPMIRAKMREGGLPEDMYYLALIESGFDANAYSRAAAVGMWQFMTSTGRGMGLRIDWWVDERRDPFKSTGAAVRFIKGLNEQFGSLYLAAAAYNGGPGRVARGLTRYADALEGTSGDDLFFALADKDYFKNETREYVPQLIAAALVAKDPERYGMRIETMPPLVYDSVRVGPATPLPAVASATGVELSEISDLNTHVLRGITPPKDSFFVRVPVGKADSFAVAFEALPQSEKLGIWTVVSKKGESLASIAKREGLNSRQLGIYNPKLKVLKNGTLAPGQSIIIPTAAVARAAAIVPDPAIERYSSSRTTRTHRVKSGETLGHIAKRYGTTVASLMKSNGLKRPLIFAGQSLVVVGRTPVAKAKPAASQSSKSAASKPAATKAKTTPAKTTAPATKSQPAPKKAN